MKTDKALVRLRAIHFKVNSIKDSIFFYKKFGFEVVETETTNSTISVYMKLNDKDQVAICLSEFFVVSEGTADNIWIEVEANEHEGDIDDRYWHHGICNELAERDVKFANMTDEQREHITPSVAEIKDPDKYVWKLINRFEYPDY